MTVTIDKFGRVLIPKALRDRLGFAPGTALELDVRDAGDGGHTLELRPERDESVLVREGSLLVHQGRLADANFDATAFLRNERDARVRKHATLEGEEG